MAKNTNRGFRRGAVTGRSQTFNPKSQAWIKRDSDTGTFLNGKADKAPFKGVRNED